MNQREKARVSGVRTVCNVCVSECMWAVDRGARGTIKGFNMSSKPHQLRASVADATGQMFISNQYEHKAITAKSYHLSSITAWLQ